VVWATWAFAVNPTTTDITAIIHALRNLLLFIRLLAAIPSPPNNSMPDQPAKHVYPLGKSRFYGTTTRLNGPSYSSL
jgi:hypothetical protein